jgi:uncharacterized protein CbrC (UPF0167 family)
MARHKYHAKCKSKAKDSSSVQCVKCGMIRQYVGGFPTYFLNDNVYHKIAPKCKGNEILKT